ncbi:MAG: TonB-dependent receptor [Halioglobus sp.]|nr:TonB-dependent receptor [Halioglobus sp.]
MAGFRPALPGRGPHGIAGIQLALWRLHVDLSHRLPRLGFRRDERFRFYRALGALADHRDHLIRPCGRHHSQQPFSADRATSTTEQWSQEFRFASDFDGPWNYLVGAFYLRANSDARFQIFSTASEAAGEVLGLEPEFRLFDNQDRDFLLETWAGFGELYWQAREDLRLTFGFRYSVEDKSSSQRTIFLSFQDDGNAPDKGFSDFEGDWEEPTGKFNISWDIQEDVLAYFTLSRSYKGGGFNPISSESPLLDPEQGGDPGLAFFDPEFINAAEVGLKSRFFDRRLQANLTYFYYDYEGLQVSKIITQTSINENFDAKVQGFEGEFIWLPDNHWRLTANLAWLDSELDGGESVDPADINRQGTTENIRSDPFGNVFAGPGCPTGTPVCPGLPKSLDGNELPSAPQFSVNLGAAYTWFLPQDLLLTTAVNYYWQDEFFTRVFNEVNDTVDSWEVWNATVNLTRPNSPWYAELWGRNLADDDAVTGQALGGQLVGLATNQFLLEPRSYGVTLGYSFD